MYDKSLLIFLTIVVVILLRSTTSTKLRNKSFWGIMFATRSLPCFTKWYDVFYKNNKKIVPTEPAGGDSLC